MNGKWASDDLGESDLDIQLVLVSNTNIWVAHTGWHAGKCTVLIECHLLGE